jgi:hypothetical protein
MIHQSEKDSVQAFINLQLVRLDLLVRLDFSNVITHTVLIDESRCTEWQREMQLMYSASRRRSGQSPTSRTSFSLGPDPIGQDHTSQLPFLFLDAAKLIRCVDWEIGTAHSPFLVRQIYRQCGSTMGGDWEIGRNNLRHSLWCWLWRAFMCWRYEHGRRRELRSNLHHDDAVICFRVLSGSMFTERLNRLFFGGNKIFGRRIISGRLNF